MNYSLTVHKCMLHLCTCSSSKCLRKPLIQFWISCWKNFQWMTEKAMKSLLPLAIACLSTLISQDCRGIWPSVLQPPSAPRLKNCVPHTKTGPRLWVCPIYRKRYALTEVVAKMFLFVFVVIVWSSICKMYVCADFWQLLEMGNSSVLIQNQF